MKTHEILINEEIKPDKQAKPGVPWENLKLTVNVKDFAQTMRANGLLSYEDVRTNTQTVVRLLQQAYRVDLGVILSFAREHEEVK